MEQKVFIASPAFDGKVHIPFALSLSNLAIAFDRAGIQSEMFVVPSGSLLVAERNRLVEAFWNSDCTHLLFIDSDLGFPPEAVLSMLNANKDFVAGVYPARNPLDPTDISFLFRPKLTPVSEGIERIVQDGHLLAAEYVPSGFMLLTRSAIKQMRDFHLELYYEPQDPTKKHEAGFLLFNTEVWQGEFWGEDFVFCRRAREAGIEIWVDPLIEFDHAGRRGMLMVHLREQEKKLNLNEPELIMESA